MANIMMDQKKFKESITYSEESSVLALECSDSITYAYSRITQGNIYGRIGDSKIAVERYQQAIPILESKLIYSELALLYSNMASCYLDLPNIDKSIFASKKSNDYSKLAGIDYYEGSNYLNLAFAYSEKGEMETALKYADLSHSIFKGKFDIEMGPDKYKLLANVYNQAKVYDKALDCLRFYDSLNIIQSDSIMKSLSLAEQSAGGLYEKDLEIQNLKDLQKKQVQLQDAQRRILMLTVGVSVFLLLLVFLLFVFMNRSAKASKDLNEKNAIINHQLDELKRQNEIQLMTIGIVGHDLRGPLSTIVRLKQSMIDLGSKGRIKELEELLEAVFSNLEKILGLSNSLVDWVLSSQSGIQFQYINVALTPIGVLMEETFNLSLAEKNLTLNLDIADNAIAYADIECVKTICRNLIQNAIKFTPENKQITFSAHLIKGINNNYVQVKITDQGMGISPLILEKIKAGKNTFSIGTKGEKGSGLGLIMVQALLSMNNGTLEISTEVGKGTTFELLIPAYISDNGKNTSKQRS
jgi:signal transduction histidine kinase